MPLGSGSRNLLMDSDITKIAKQMEKTNAQVSIYYVGFKGKNYSRVVHKENKYISRFMFEEIV